MTREEAIKNLRCWQLQVPTVSRDYEAFAVAINALEVIDNAPNTKTGEWALPNKELTDRPMAECSICGWYVNPKWVDDYNFCPNCGADMRGDDND